MYSWCLQFSQKTNLKTQIFAQAYWGRIFLFVFWENWKKQNVLSKSTDLYQHRQIWKPNDSSVHDSTAVSKNLSNFSMKWWSKGTFENYWPEISTTTLPFLLKYIKSTWYNQTKYKTRVLYNVLVLTRRSCLTYSQHG